VRMPHWEWGGTQGWRWTPSLLTSEPGIFLAPIQTAMEFVNLTDFEEYAKKYLPKQVAVKIQEEEKEKGPGRLNIFCALEL